MTDILTDAQRLASRSKGCEACGLVGGGKIFVRVTNGGLSLCGQCLDDINRKNPTITPPHQRPRRRAAGESSRLEI